MRDVETTIDYIGLISRLLTLTDELNRPDDARDELGNLAPGLYFPRLAFRDHPSVDEAVQTLKQQLVEHNLLRIDELLPRWPNEKRYAVLITHDTDGPCLLEPKELCKAGLKGLVRLNIPEMQAFIEGSRKILTKGRDPYFNFSNWAEFEQIFSTQSAFYIYVRSREVPDHIHNPLYHVDKSREKWNILSSLAELGWEIGLHVSINALQKDHYIQAEKTILEDFLGKQVVGARCHYWSMNWRNPNEFSYTWILLDSRMIVQWPGKMHLGFVAQPLPHIILMTFNMAEDLDS